MASEPAELVKHRRHYDLSMSRRTRKPKIVAEAPPPDRDGDGAPVPPVGGGGDDAHRSSSLEELMNEAGGAGGLALVIRKQGGGAGAAKVGGVVSKCVKVLSHLVRAKRDSKKESAVLRLKP